LIKFEYDIENFNITDVSIGTQERLMDLADNGTTFNLKNLTIDLNFDYSYCSDPPIFIDSGNLKLSIKNTTMDLNLSTYMANNSLFQVDIHSLDIV